MAHRVLLWPLLPLLFLLLGAVSANTQSSWSLIPAVALNESLALQYACRPHGVSPAPAPCSGQGSCYVLVDANDNASLPVVNASTIAPLPLTDFDIDTSGIDASQLPVAVCVCDSGYTSRSDWIQRPATDGASCALPVTTTTVLLTVWLTAFAILAAFALYKLWQWYGWHRSLRPSRPAASSHSTKPSHSNVVMSISQLVPMMLAHQHHQHYRTQSVSPLINTTTTATIVHGSPGRSPSPATKTRHVRSQTRINLHHHLHAIHQQHSLRQSCETLNFLHPFFTLLAAVFLILFLLLRLGTDMVLGSHYGMSVLACLFFQCTFIAMSIAQFFSSKVSVNVARPGATVASSSLLIKRIKILFVVGIVVNEIVRAVLFLLLASASVDHSGQEILFVLLMTVSNLGFWSIGAIGLYNAYRTGESLKLGLETLSEHQKHDREHMVATIWHHGQRTFLVLLLHMVASLVFVCSSYVRVYCEYALLVSSGTLYVLLFSRVSMLHEVQKERKVVPVFDLNHSEHTHNRSVTATPAMHRPHSIGQLPGSPSPLSPVIHVNSFGTHAQSSVGMCAVVGASSRATTPMASACSAIPEALTVLPAMDRQSSDSVPSTSVSPLSPMVYQAIKRMRHTSLLDPREPGALGAVISSDRNC